MTACKCRMCWFSFSNSNTGTEASQHLCLSLTYTGFGYRLQIANCDPIAMEKAMSAFSGRTGSAFLRGLGETAVPGEERV